LFVSVLLCLSGFALFRVRLVFHHSLLVQLYLHSDLHFY
jgi:hypothetical protein